MWISVKMSFISVMRSCIFSIITPVFSVTWSSEIIIILIIINVENLLCYQIFLRKQYNILFFRILWWIESSKEQHLFEKEIFCNIIINGFTVTFDQFNASLLNKLINFQRAKKILLTPKLLNSIVFKEIAYFCHRIIIFKRTLQVYISQIWLFFSGF